MKRQFLSLLATAALLTGISQPAQTTAQEGIGEVVQEAPVNKPAPKVQTVRTEQPVVAIRQSPVVPYSSVRYKDISGPRRVKYGKHRWVQLT